MSLQTDLQNAVAQATTDSGLLHQIVHGMDTATVATEGGTVKAVAKLLRDADERINVAAGSILAQAGEGADQAQAAAIAAESSALRAETAAARALPEISSTDAGKEVRVKPDASGYELVHSAMLLAPVFYGFRRVNNRLQLARSDQQGSDSFTAFDYITVLLAPAGIQFTVQANGHMVATF
ncbi:hypothetical protein [Rhodoferax antarcticus]|uniref:hypothetical protein n=1 Tax=Rhodoferax antarcticus TaxID=81479 RepID=UPI002224A677|nr:hypothetical protein [Rhodoferax antarcticus]MCW2313355.1 hypothetical protein [Rhodoferax antarcticus]